MMKNIILIVIGVVSVILYTVLLDRIYKKLRQIRKKIESNDTDKT